MSSWISPRAKLLAEHFDLKYPGPEPGELEYLVRRIAEGGEPALELGCGTGRVLVPLLERGVDVSGIDVSEDMLASARTKCEAKGLYADLRVQSMEKLDLDHRFGTIFMGSCGLGVLTSADEVAETFHRTFAHLNPGGVFSFEISTPPTSGSTIERQGVWTGGWNECEDGATLTSRLVFEYDAETHVRRSVMIFERYVDGRLGETELHRTSMRFWEVDEVFDLLTAAGFVEGVATKVFTDDAPPDDEWLAVRARKP